MVNYEKTTSELKRDNLVLYIYKLIIDYLTAQSGVLFFYFMR